MIGVFGYLMSLVLRSWKPGHGRPISFRILHVFQFREGLISRENVWLDTAAVVSQLS